MLTLSARRDVVLCEVVRGLCADFAQAGGNDG